MSETAEAAELVEWVCSRTAEDEETPARTRDVREVYKVVCERHAADPVSVRSVREHLAELEQLGITSSTIENQGVEGGKYKQYTLEQSVDSVRSGLAGLLDE